ncbi:MAG TPA: ATP synthase F0 subunit C [Candidatus Angelobacter sp.]|jgi:F-type H+-transporting ATPase subunit c|nr:ATP synthase F0 subunit C [Candidatus Angelobacter sp.]
MSKKTAFIFLAVVVVLCVAMPAYAQGGDAAAASSNAFYWAIPLGAGAAIGIAAGLCGLGQGKATASAVEALARNPAARPGIFIFLLLGLALIESLALYALVIAFQLIGKMK